MKPIARHLVGSALCIFLCGSAHAQSLFARNQARVNLSQSQQPHWISPLITTTPRLEQTVRTDYLRPRNSAGYNTWSLGGNRGLQVMPFRSVQLSFNLPPFIDHTAPKQKDGFGDVSFTFRYRILSRNEAHGNALITAVLNATVPTGKNGNGSCCAVVTPSVAMGKGWGGFVLTTVAGGSLPVSNVVGLGRTISWNTTAQYSARSKGIVRFFWPEVESNTSFFVGGPNDGRTQSFVTPGLVVGRLPLRHREEAGEMKRLAISIGAGVQIAVTHFHSYNHELVLTSRLRF